MAIIKDGHNILNSSSTIIPSISPVMNEFEEEGVSSTTILEENEEEEKMETEMKSVAIASQSKGKEKIRVEEGSDVGDDDFEEEDNFEKESEEKESDVGDDDFEEEDNFEKESEEELQDEKLKNRVIDIGKSLHILLANLHKIPVPPPTNNPQISPEEYRKIVTNYLLKDDEYSNCIDDFTPTETQTSQKSSLNFILDDNNQSTNFPNCKDIFIPVESQTSQKTSMDFILNNNDQTTPITQTKIDYEYVNPDLACSVISSTIVNIYKNILENHVCTEILRRRQFRDILLINDHYEKLQIYCMRSKERTKGITAKSQAIQWIIRSSKPAKNEPPMIKAPRISKLIRGALRIKRLLELSNNNYNILYTFPDLKIDFFITTSMSVVNYERWLRLVESGIIISLEEGKKLYEEHKILSKERKRSELSYVL
jgi:hypothetical protein